MNDAISFIGGAAVTLLVTLAFLEATAEAEPQQLPANVQVSPDLDCWKRTDLYNGTTFGCRCPSD